MAFARKLSILLSLIVAFAISQAAPSLADNGSPTMGSASIPSASSAQCNLFTGPREVSDTGVSLAPNQFLLTVTNNDGTAFSLTGTYRTSPDGRVHLSTNRRDAQTAITQIFQQQASGSSVKFHLSRLRTKIYILPAAAEDDYITCNVSFDGTLKIASASALPTGDPSNPATDVTSKIRDHVDMKYRGIGIYYPPVPPSAPQTCSFPANLQPNAQSCSGAANNCLLDFAGYKWWTYNAYYPPPPDNAGYFWNQNNVWSPRNANVDSGGLHLYVRPDNVGQGSEYMAAEVVLLEDSSGNPVYLGYGKYLVNAYVNTASSWDAMDPNVTLGLFTYERDGTGTTDNPNRELDLAEISRWGHPKGQKNCVDRVPQLCEGNAQFTLQNYEALPGFENVHRYTIDPGVNQITLVMTWNGANQPVVFQQYNGTYTLSTLPATANHEWTTSANQDRFIPAAGCERFHINFWMGNYPQANDNGRNPPPAAPQEVTITNFQFQPPAP